MGGEKILLLVTVDRVALLTSNTVCQVPFGALKLILQTDPPLYVS